MNGWLFRGSRPSQATQGGQVVVALCCRLLEVPSGHAASYSLHHWLLGKCGSGNRQGSRGLYFLPELLGPPGSLCAPVGARNSRAAAYSAFSVHSAQSLSCAQLFAIPWTVAHQAPLSMGFPRREYWSGLPFPSPWDLPNPGIEPASPALGGRFFTTEPSGEPLSDSSYIFLIIFFFWIILLWSFPRALFCSVSQSSFFF